MPQQNYLMNHARVLAAITGNKRGFTLFIGVTMRPVVRLSARRKPIRGNLFVLFYFRNFKGAAELSGKNNALGAVRARVRPGRKIMPARMYTFRNR